MATQIGILHVHVKPLNAKVRLFYKQAWGKRYYSFDQVCWQPSKTQAYTLADPAKFSYVRA